MLPVSRITGTVVALLLFAAAASAAPGGTLPMRIVTFDVEPAAQEMPEPAVAEGTGYRRLYENPERLQAAIDAQERHTQALLQQQRARGTAVGWSEAGDPVIKVYAGPNTQIGNIPPRLDGLPVVIEQTGPLYALNVACDDRYDQCGRLPEPGVAVASATDEPGPTEWHPRPVPIGISAGHIDVTAGTLACRVTQGCHTYALSNAHVFADENSGIPGDNILQPGKYDGGLNPADAIGVLFDSVPISISQFAFNRVDAAIAEVTTATVSTATPSDGYGTPRVNPINPVVGLNVKKYGRTTGLTNGYIDAINATVLVTYDAGDARFVGQVIIKPDTGSNFSRPGDRWWWSTAVAMTAGRWGCCLPRAPALAWPTPFRTCSTNSTSSSTVNSGLFDYACKNALRRHRGASGRILRT